MIEICPCDAAIQSSEPQIRAPLSNKSVNTSPRPYMHANYKAFSDPPATVVYGKFRGASCLMRYFAILFHPRRIALISIASFHFLFTRKISLFSTFFLIISKTFTLCVYGGSLQIECFGHATGFLRILRFLNHAWVTSIRFGQGLPRQLRLKM